MMHLTIPKNSKHYLEYAVKLSIPSDTIDEFRTTALNVLLRLIGTKVGCLMGINQTGDSLVSFAKEQVNVINSTSILNNSRFAILVKQAWREQTPILVKNEFLYEEGIVFDIEADTKNNKAMCLPLIGNSTFKNAICLIWNIDDYWLEKNQLSSLINFGKLVASFHDWHNLIHTSQFNERMLHKSISHLSKSSEKLSETMPKILRTKIIGNSDSINSVREKIIRYSISDKPTIIGGETGTGKDLVAELLHDISPWGDNKFIRKNLSQIPDNQLEQDLLGYMDKDSKGAPILHEGIFTKANAGTLYLDEIDKISPRIQHLILDVLETKTVKPIGSEELIETNFRLITSSNQSLEKLVAANEFRKDLYFRLKQLVIDIPALRDRSNDCILLANYFLRDALQRYQKPIAVFSDCAVAELQTYSFPGNVREMQAFIEIIALNHNHKIIDASDIKKYLDSRTLELAISSKATIDVESVIDISTYPSNLNDACELFECDLIEKSFKKNAGDRKKISEVLQIPKSTLADKLKRYNIG